MKVQWSAWEEREAVSAMVTAVALCPAWRVASGLSVERPHGSPAERVLGTRILCTLVSARTSTGSMATLEVSD